MFGKIPFSHVFESNKDGSGNRWHAWQYLAANSLPFVILDNEVSECVLFLLKLSRQENSIIIKQQLMMEKNCNKLNLDANIYLL